MTAKKIWFRKSLVEFKNVPVKRIGSPSIVSGRKLVYPAGYTDTDWHVHESGLLAHVETGAVGMRTETRSFVVSAGMTMFIPPGFPHYETSMGSLISVFAVSLPFERTRFMPKDFQILQTTPLLKGLIERIVSWGSIEDSNKTPAQKRLVLTFLDELAAAEPANHLSIPYPQTESLRAVANEIMAAPEDVENIDYWAKRAGMSRRSFTKYFVQETGLTFVVWRQLVKIREGLKALAAGESVTDIAFRLGYHDSSTFGAVFKKQFGVSPTQFIQAGHLSKVPDEIILKPTNRSPSEVGEILKRSSRIGS